MNQVELNFDMIKTRSTGEALKSLRANVQFCGTDVHCIVMTSCLPGDGKSTTSMGLSISLAQAGKKVLLVDADLRKSMMLKSYTDIRGAVGFSEYLSGLKSLDDVKYNTQFGNLQVIFCGQYPANPTELLSSTAFKSFIDEQKQYYDYIIIDTPPLGLVVDAAVIASVCDSAIMVLPEGKIKGAHANKVLEQLKKSGAKVIGAVINKQDVKVDKYGYSKKYSYRYSSYYGEK